MSIEKVLKKLLRGESDANLRFDELCHVLKSKGFHMRVSGSHHIFTRAGVFVRINLREMGRQQSLIKLDRCERFWQITS